MSFKDLISHKGLLKAIEESGYDTATPIQQEAIPLVLQGSDLLASAHTGTGKTAAFLLPALQRLTVASVTKGRGPRVLILVPTRELAIQVAAEADKYSPHLTQIKTISIYGGAPYPLQHKQLSGPYEILVATPGRLIDHIERGRIDFKRLEIMIIDEADRMLDMGFIEPVERIAARTPASRQTLMFSATLKGAVLHLSKRLLRDPKKISVASECVTHENIAQQMHLVNNLEHKYNLLEEVLIDTTLEQAVIFTSTKSQADVIADKLAKSGHKAKALHGDMRQRERTRTIMQLRKQQIRILVATDVAARGIDVQSISHVINFDLPMNVEDYVHRIGRTGRAGKSGLAMSFVSRKDMGMVKKIEQFTGKKMAVQPTTMSKAAQPYHLNKPNHNKPNHNKPSFKRRNKPHRAGV
jgi:superfamily II DNA/RNA helicase